MPPKEKLEKEKHDIKVGSESEEDSSDIKNVPKEQDDPQPGPSTASESPQRTPFKADKPPPSREDIMKSPVCKITSDKIVARKIEPLSVRPKVRKPHQEAGEPFEKVIMLHLDKKRFTDDQRKSWLSRINKIRRDRSLSSLPTEYETEASREVAHLKYTEEEMSDFCEKLGKDDYWDSTDSTNFQITAMETETSSDSESEMKEPEIRSPLRRSLRLKPKRPSWKEYKKGKNFGAAYFKWQVDHFGVAKVVKKIVKTIFRKKKQEYIQKDDGRSIEVGKHEVQDFLFEAVGFMEKRYLAQIKAAACHIYPTDDDKFESDFESGTYDSQDEWLPNNESISSRINKMSVSVSTGTLKEYGLLDILIATLPMTLNYNDPAETLEFVDILKLARNRVPEHISIRNVPSTSKSHKEEKPTGGNTIICTALVEPPPNLERLKKTGARDYLRQLPAQETEESETKSVSNGVKEHLKKPKDSGSESLMQIESIDTSEDSEPKGVSSSEGISSPGVTEQSKRGQSSPEPPTTPSKKKNPEI